MDGKEPKRGVLGAQTGLVERCEKKRFIGEIEGFMEWLDDLEAGGWSEM